MAIFAVTMLIIPFAAADRIALAATSEKDIAAGSTWEVTKTTKLSKLVIAEGATIKAGVYNGKIVLKVNH